MKFEKRFDLRKIDMGNDTVTYLVYYSDSCNGLHVE